MGLLLVLEPLKIYIKSHNVMLINLLEVAVYFHIWSFQYKVHW